MGNAPYKMKGQVEVIQHSRRFLKGNEGAFKTAQTRGFRAIIILSQPMARPISDLWTGGRGESPPRNISSSKDALGGLIGVE